MFIDWLTVTQEYDYDLPVVCDVFTVTIDSHTGEHLTTRQPRFKHQGSFSSLIMISVQGRKVRVEGNPSRINRLDNLFGYQTVGECLPVYNSILAEYGLPALTRGTRLEYRQSDDGTKARQWSDGCSIERIDLTTNVGVGQGNVLAYLRALSTQRVANSIGFLFPNGRTVDWTASGKRKGGARLQYRKVYDKAFELSLNLIPKIKRLHGDDSKESAYVARVHQYCADHGVVRFEQELKAEYLSRENLRFYGLFDESRFQTIHDEFLTTDERLQVTAMDLQTISQTLQSQGICASTYAANTTALYAYNWMNGQTFDFSKSQVQTHRARLRKIGIDIANQCDHSRFTPVIVSQAREVTKTYQLPMPEWYRQPRAHLRAVA